MSGIKNKKDARDAESPTAPDSTTKEKAGFNIGDEVLMKRKDGNFYLGTVVQVDTAREQCLVKFGDNTESWSTLKHLTKLSTGYDEVMCVMCKRSQPKPNNEIVVCDRCSRGYHQLCHQPVISSECIGSGTFWQCRRCQVPLIKELRAYRKKAAQPSPPPLPPKPKSPSPLPPISPPTPILPLSPPEPPKINKLPYDLKSLVWDLQHKVNSEQKYCYCGGSGNWYIKMLQCMRCRQWFHEHCISCLQFPLYLGDRFYVFVCSVCNFGVEFVRRLELNWIDLVHLALFNMTVFKAQKYHDVDEDIVYFINCNWSMLQLPPKIYDVRFDDRREIIMNILLKNSKRFKCGRELKKRAALWGLRLRIPPQAPTIHPLPETNRTLSEKDLLESWSNLKPEVKFLTHTNRPVMQPIKTELPPPPPQNGKVLNGVWDTYPLIPKSFTEPLAGVKLLHIDTRPLLLPKGMPATGHKSQKISQDLPPTPPSSLPTPEISQLNSSSVSTIPSLATPITSGETSSSDDASSRGTLDLFIPPPKDFEGKNNPFRSVSELLGSSVPPNPPITLPLPLTPVITQPMLRPTKRRLSEKDIRIDRNGEVKRRRLRRQCTSSTANKDVETLPCASWNSAKSLRNMYNPTSNANSLDSAINGKRMRRSSKQQKPCASVTPTSSPIKNSPSVSLNDLKNSVNIYFGAANRIASGEKFKIKAKRITPQGRTQYLIEWENPVT